MARYTGPVCRLCRREGEKLFLKGDRCFSSKCSVERREGSPGVHAKHRGHFSEYKQQLREKQELRLHQPRQSPLRHRLLRQCFHLLCSLAST